jgi:hypothetical protein
MFDPIAYMQTLHGKLKATKTKYKFTTVSGVDNLEGILQNSRHDNYFLAVDDSEEGVTFRGAGGGFFERRQYTVFILGKAKYGDMVKRAEVMAEARGIYRSLVSKLVKDKNSIPVINTEQIRFHEVPPAFATGCSGLYFHFTVENAIELVYNAADWES